MNDAEKLRQYAQWLDELKESDSHFGHIPSPMYDVMTPNLRRIADDLERKAVSDEEIDVDLALKINTLVHNECEKPPHDIGYRIVEIMREKLAGK